jgi:serine/threonine-protein kinase
MQGAELSASGIARRSSRARTARLLAIATCSLIALGGVLIAGRHFGAFGKSADGESVDSYLESGRDCLRRHAWDSPAHENVKEVTERALLHFPGDPRILELRRDAAERLVGDAVGRKYAGDNREALHLAKLALEFDPSQTTAQHLAAELEGGAKAPEVAPASSEPKEPDRPGAPKTSARKTTTTKGTAPQATGAPTTSANVGPVLPPTPPPLPTDQAPPPAPSSSGPWL